jgi:hypothetical protein
VQSENKREKSGQRTLSPASGRKSRRSLFSLEELHQEFYLAVGRLREKPHLVRSFLAQAGLKI